MTMCSPSFSGTAGAALPFRVSWIDRRPCRLAMSGIVAQNAFEPAPDADVVCDLSRRARKSDHHATPFTIAAKAWWRFDVAKAYTDGKWLTVAIAFTDDLHELMKFLVMKRPLPSAGYPIPPGIAEDVGPIARRARE
jgi:hypothetical protein